MPAEMSVTRVTMRTSPSTSIRLGVNHMRKQVQIRVPALFPDRLWNVKETAEFLGIPASTLYYWSHTGEGGPPILRIGRTLRYNPHSVIAWAQKDAS